MVQCFFAVIVTSVSRFSHVCFITLKHKAYLKYKYEQELIDQLISSGFSSNKTLLSSHHEHILGGLVEGHYVVLLDVNLLHLLKLASKETSVACISNPHIILDWDCLVMDVRLLSKFKINSDIHTDDLPVGDVVGELAHD